MGFSLSDKKSVLSFDEIGVLSAGKHLTTDRQLATFLAELSHQLKMPF